MLAMKTKRKNAYNDCVIQVEHGSFTPLVFSTSGGESPECRRYHQRLASFFQPTERKHIQKRWPTSEGKFVSASFALPSFPSEVIGSPRAYLVQGLHWVRPIFPSRKLLTGVIKHLLMVRWRKACFFSSLRGETVLTDCSRSILQ